MSQKEADQQIDMTTYSISLPRGWYVEKRPGEVIFACNRRNGKCTGTGGGFPLAGSVFI